MAKGSRKKGVAFPENNSWYHRTKTLKEDGTITYSKKGGFATEDAAVASYWQYEKEFNTAYKKYQITNQINSDIFFRDYLIYWFEEEFSSRIESTTRMVGAYAIYYLILPQIDYDIKLRHVNVDYLNNLLEKIAKVTASAGNKGREILNLALKDAVISGYIKYNPVQNTRVYKRKKPNIIILSKSKIKVLLKSASESNWYLEILLALFCGLRKGEIMGLKFSDFDLNRKTVYISRQIASDPKILREDAGKISEYGLVERDPKTPNSFRVLRVPDVILQELQKRKLQVEKNIQIQGIAYVDNDYICCQNNGKLHSLSAMNNALTRLCNKSGLPPITVHGLRHMYATILIEMGVPLVKISALLGHGSIHTTFEYYCDVMDENENILAFMNNAFVPMKEKVI